MRCSTYSEEFRSFASGAGNRLNLCLLHIRTLQLRRHTGPGTGAAVAAVEEEAACVDYAAEEAELVGSGWATREKGCFHSYYLPNPSMK